MRKGRKAINLYVPEDLLRECKDIASLRNQTFTDFIIGIMTKEVNQEKYIEALMIMDKLRQDELMSQERYQT